MTDYSRLTPDLAAARIAERLAEAERARVPGPRRPHGRHAFARQLHRLADRLDT